MLAVRLQFVVVGACVGGVWVCVGLTPPKEEEEAPCVVSPLCDVIGGMCWWDGGMGRVGQQGLIEAMNPRTQFRPGHARGMGPQATTIQILELCFAGMPPPCSDALAIAGLARHVVGSHRLYQSRQGASHCPWMGVLSRYRSIRIPSAVNQSTHRHHQSKPHRRAGRPRPALDRPIQSRTPPPIHRSTHPTHPSITRGERDTTTT